MSEFTFPPSDHCDGQRFFNPGVSTDKSFADLLRWRRLRERVQWPAQVVNPPAPPPPAQLAPGEASFTFIGHSTYLIQIDGFRLITDPVFSERASPFTFAGPKRVRPPGLPLDELPPIDAILLSHNHYDHMDLASLRRLQGRGTPSIVTGLGNGRYLERRKIGPAIELDWWDSVEVKPGLSVTYVPAQHWSSRTVSDRRRMLWGGHVVTTRSRQIYFAGDTGYFGGFRAIRERLGSPDVAILPIGAYAPRWFMRLQHMDPADAVMAHREIGAGVSLAAHWGTFQLTDEGLDDPLQALAAARSAEHIAPGAFQAPLPGQSVIVRLDDRRARDG